MKRILFAAFYFFTLTTFGCQCPELPLLDKKSFSTYELVLFGKVEELKECSAGNQKVVFQVLELYKGDLSKELVSIDFSCETNTCFTEFNEGEQWLVYCKKNNAQDFILPDCSHTRKLIENGQIDYQEEMRGSSFFEDKTYLSSNFGIEQVFENDLKPKKYEKVDDRLIPVFLGVSLLFMIIGMLIFRKKKIK